MKRQPLRRRRIPEPGLLGRDDPREPSYLLPERLTGPQRNRRLQLRHQRQWVTGGHHDSTDDAALRRGEPRGDYRGLGAADRCREPVGGAGRARGDGHHPVQRQREQDEKQDGTRRGGTRQPPGRAGTNRKHDLRTFGDGKRKGGKPDGVRRPLDNV